MGRRTYSLCTSIEAGGEGGKGLSRKILDSGLEKPDLKKKPLFGTSLLTVGDFDGLSSTVNDSLK